MATIIRRRDNYSIVERLNGKQKWRSLHTDMFCVAVKHSAEDLKRSRMSKMRTITAFLDELVAYLKANVAAATQELYSNSLRKLAQVIGDKPIKALHILDVERFKVERLKQVSPVRVNIELRTLRAAFNIAVNWGIVAENIFKRVKLLRVPFKDPVFMTKDEAIRLLAVIRNNEFLTLVLVALMTMMRRGEIINLTWDDLNFDRGTIHIRNKTDFNVKANKPRVIPMSEAVQRLLDGKRRRGDYVFTDDDGKKFDGGFVSRKFKEYVRKVGLSEELHFHSLRHTGASWLVQQSVPLFHVQKLLGHSSQVTTQIYSHLADEHLRGAIDKIQFQMPQMLT